MSIRIYLETKKPKSLDPNPNDAYPHAKKIYIPDGFRVLDKRYDETTDPRGIAIACDPGSVSDGYHTFNELYDHRCLLFCALSHLAKDYWDCWKSKDHWVDGNLESVWEGWFLAGINLGVGQITYHMPFKYWDLFAESPAREKLDVIVQPPFDGHTSIDILLRLEDFCRA